MGCRLLKSLAKKRMLDCQFYPPDNQCLYCNNQQALLKVQSVYRARLFHIWNRAIDHTGVFWKSVVVLSHCPHANLVFLTSYLSPK